MSRAAAVGVASAVLVSSAGAAFAVFLAVSQIEELLNKYFAGRPMQYPIASPPPEGPYPKPRSIK